MAILLSLALGFVFGAFALVVLCRINDAVLSWIAEFGSKPRIKSPAQYDWEVATDAFPLQD
ncbi:MAG: hypothetical protein A2825_00775 [Candidatus Taylorbacteria bacterium RIFCSPHIGHO2_01_FULL_43_120]|nr:MAG: hypothetical protein A2825_00775 [Candidatus Taylorbacteria bacterium RIFCSPHIGHO2_01_FULL_43_120]